MEIETKEGPVKGPVLEGDAGPVISVWALVLEGDAWELFAKRGMFAVGLGMCGVVRLVLEGWRRLAKISGMKGGKNRLIPDF